MLTDEEIDKLDEIFYAEAPYDFVLVHKKSKPGLNGICDPASKVCVLYRREEYQAALLTVFHELAHARYVTQGHTLNWEMEFTRLLKKYNYPKADVTKYHYAIGPKLREYING